MSLEVNEASTKGVPAAVMYCDIHKDNQLELYCYDCNENGCVLCFEDKHRNHKSDTILEATGTLRPRIEKDAEEILSSIGDVQLHFEMTECKASIFTRKVEYAKEKVIGEGEWIKRSVDVYVGDCLDELESVKSESDKQLEIVQEQLQLELVAMESFHAYSRELLDKGRPCDVTRAAKELHKRAVELLDNYGTSLQYSPPDVNFTSADTPKLKSGQLIGELTITNSGNSPGKPLKLRFSPAYANRPNIYISYR